MKPCAGIPILILLAVLAAACQSGPRPAAPLPAAGEPPALAAEAATSAPSAANGSGQPPSVDIGDAMTTARGEAQAALARAAAQPFAPMTPSYTVQPSIIAPRASQRDRVEWGMEGTSVTIALKVVDAHYEPAILDDLKGTVSLMPALTGVPLMTYSAAIENFMLQRNAINDAYNFYAYGKLVVQVAARNVTKEQWNKTITMFVFDDTGRLMKSESVTQYFRPKQTIYLRYEYPNTPRFARWMMRVSD